jgi:hydrogenase maturation factor HypF (carbamoyltransferase family)
LRCTICGTTIHVIDNIQFDSRNKSFKAKPVCLDCKLKELELNNIISWEKELKNLELTVAYHLIAKKYPKIKFKHNAVQIMLGLMKKYSLRCVLDTCILSDDDFNPHLLDRKCQQRFAS